jgi:hypothetical protein
MAAEKCAKSRMAHSSVLASAMEMLILVQTAPAGSYDLIAVLSRTESLTSAIATWNSTRYTGRSMRRLKNMSAAYPTSKSGKSNSAALSGDYPKADSSHRAGVLADTM